jgi:type IV fimbrial biogenesis protein FimT
MIVVAIVGILAAIALPSFKGLSESQRVKTASFELYSLLSVARSEAIKRNDNVTIAPVLSGSTWLRLEVTTAGGAVIRSKAQPAKVDFTFLPSGTTSVVFTRTGRPTTSGITFQVDVEGSATPTTHVRCISIGLSGMPQTRKGAC